MNHRLCPSRCRNPRCRALRKRRAGGGFLGSRGLCQACYSRLRRAGYPAEVPEPGTGPRRSARREGRIEDYLDLRSWGVSRAAAAIRLGVSRRTIERYEADLRQRAEASNDAPMRRSA